MSEHSVADYREAVRSALEAHDVKAVPGLLVLMALDGHADEAERLRKTLLRTASDVKGDR